MGSPWNQSVLFGSARGGDEEKDRWATPPEIFDPLHAEFGFGLDVAAATGTATCMEWLGPEHPDPTRHDGLSASWHALSPAGRPAWCNPPYSIAGDFLRVGRLEAQNHGLVSVHLVFARTDTRWWWESVLGRDRDTQERTGLCAAEIRWRKGRVKFIDPQTGKPRAGAPAPSVAIVFRPGFTGEWPTNRVL